MSAVRLQTVCFNLTALVNTSESEVVAQETYVITKVCFALCLFSTLIHLLLLVWLPHIRRMYGVFLVVGLHASATAHLATLIACSADREVWYSRVASLTASIAFLAGLGVNLLSAWSVCHLVSTWRVSRRDSLIKHLHNLNTASITSLRPNCLIDPAPSEVGLCGCFHDPTGPVARPVTGCALPLIVVLLLSTVVMLAGSVCFPASPGLSKDAGQNITATTTTFVIASCGLINSHGQFLVFFIFLFLLLAVQLALLMAVSKRCLGAPEDRVQLHQERDVTARYCITLKLAITHTIVWSSGVVAVYRASVAVWNMFTLFSSLQAIYITINCTFSRPVFDLVHWWHEDEPGKPEESL
ncbi:unnamed protein product, partial [Protopolystoma xenopodis]